MNILLPVQTPPQVVSKMVEALQSGKISLGHDDVEQVLVLSHAMQVTSHLLCICWSSALHTDAEIHTSLVLLILDACMQRCHAVHCREFAALLLLSSTQQQMMCTRIAFKYKQMFLRLHMTTGFAVSLLSR